MTVDKKEYYKPGRKNIFMTALFYYAEAATNYRIEHFQTKLNGSSCNLLFQKSFRYKKRQF